MYKIKFHIKVQDYLSGYFSLYRKYYDKLYEDSGLWNENQIINGYISESIQRKEEIIELIEERISAEEILGKSLDNTIFLRWRTKYIFIKWKENNSIKTRYIINIDIR